MYKGLVSVVIPIYNVERYLDCCITSVVQQTYRNLEILLINDGSPDKCPAMCDAWAARDSRIRVIHKQNAGLGMARNTGIEHATGEYICFFDSDDYISPETIEKALALAQREQADVVIFGITNVDIEGNPISTLIPQTEKPVFTSPEVQQVLLPDMLDSGLASQKNKGLHFSSCGCLYAMQLIQKLNWRFVSERENISEDTFSLILLYRYIERAAILPEPFYHYRTNSSSLTRSYRVDRFEKCKLFYRDTTRLALDLGYDEVVQQRISGLFCSFIISVLKQSVFSDLPPRKQLAQIRRIIRDATVQSALRQLTQHYTSKPKTLLYALMRWKCSPLVWLLVRIKLSRNGK